MKRTAPRRSTVAAVVTIVVCALVVAAGVTGVLVSDRAATSAEPTRSPAAVASASPVATAETVTADGVRIVSGIPYTTAPDGQPVLLDACEPAAAGGDRAAVLLVHGGAWIHGRRGDWLSECRWLAGAGFVAFTLDYSLAPYAVFPTAVDEISRAVEWTRDRAQRQRFGIDPERIGLVGGSAGGNLAALAALRGHGSLTSGSRVAAFVDLSGPVDLTAAGQRLGRSIAYLAPAELEYLGCSSFARCPAARRASPLYQVDASDPPGFIAGSSHEIVAFEQDAALATALSSAGVPHTLVEVPGSRHAQAVLGVDDVRARVLAFLRTHLG